MNEVSLKNRRDKNKKPSAEKLAKIDQMLAELDQQKNSSDKKQ